MPYRASVLKGECRNLSFSPNIIGVMKFKVNDVNGTSCTHYGSEKCETLRKESIWDTKT